MFACIGRNRGRSVFKRRHEVNGTAAENFNRLLRARFLERELFRDA
jgi:hypothetical protein